MSRLAAIMLIALLGCLSVMASVAEAKGPPGKVVISGGDLRSGVVIERSDLVPFETDGFLEITGTSPAVYAQGVEIAGETPYVVSIFLLEDSDNVPQLFLSGNYFPSNSDHPGLFADGGSLWKVQPEFAALIDGRIYSSASTALFPANAPNTGGPPGSGTANDWAYALLAAGALLLVGSAAAVAYSRRS